MRNQAGPPAAQRLCLCGSDPLGELAQLAPVAVVAMGNCRAGCYNVDIQGVSIPQYLGGIMGYIINGAVHGYERDTES